MTERNKLILDSKLSVEIWRPKNDRIENNFYLDYCKDKARDQIASKIALDYVSNNFDESVCLHFSGYFFTRKKLIDLIEIIEKEAFDKFRSMITISKPKKKTKGKK